MANTKSTLPSEQQLEKAGKGWVHTGNRIIVKIDNKIIGLIQSMQCSDDYGVQPANTIGHIEAQELIPLESNHTISVSMMLLAADSMYKTADGYRAIPESGELTDSTRNDALKARALEFHVIAHHPGSPHDGKLLCAYLGVVYSSGTVDVTANRITISNAVFRATHRWGTFNVNDQRGAAQQRNAAFQIS